MIDVGLGRLVHVEERGSRADAMVAWTIREKVVMTREAIDTEAGQKRVRSVLRAKLIRALREDADSLEQLQALEAASTSVAAST